MITTGNATIPYSIPLPVPLLDRDPWWLLVYARLNTVFQRAVEIPFDDSSRLVFMSDIHRGDGSCVDAFAGNERLFNQVLGQYAKDGFSYLEVGDGDELWKHRRLKDIQRAHPATFDLLHTLNDAGRLHMILGNHDMSGLQRHQIDKGGLVALEALILRHVQTGQGLFVTHGHQADIISDRLRIFSRIAVRHVWRRLQRYKRQCHQIGLRIPRWRRSELPQHTRIEILKKIEQRLIAWADTQQQIVICGHTHRPMLPTYGEPPYFNTGSCVSPYSLTAIELKDATLSLVRWTENASSGAIRRHAVAQPRRLHTLP